MLSISKDLMTMKNSFYNLNDKSKEKKVNIIQMTDDFIYYENKEVQLIRLPYKKYSMPAKIILSNGKKI